MPLKPGKSNVGKNVKELMKSYKKKGKIGTSKPKSKKAAQKQAVAIALNKAGESKVKKESYDEIVNDYLKSYLIEAPYVEYEGGREDIDPREGMDEPQDHVEQPTDAQMMYQTVKDYFVEYFGGGVEGQELAMRKLHFMDPDEIKEVYHAIDSGELESGMSPPAESLREDEEGEDQEEECEYAAQGCKCGGCPACEANRKQAEGGKPEILDFYFSK